MRLAAAASFVRFSALGGTLILPLLGAASTGSRLPSRDLVAMLVAATSFHLFAYVLNDVVDLPIDCTEPRRSVSPLVTGAVRPGQALAFALAQVPVAGAIAARASWRPEAPIGLSLAFALLAVYNVFGKRCRVPPSTDLIQGVGWAALLLFGAGVGGRSTAATWLVAAFVTVFIVMANGVHGALRDLPNDHRCGVRSTAIWMGASARPTGGLCVPRRLLTYVWGLHGLLLGVLLVPLAAGIPRYPAATRVWTAGGLVVMGAVTSALLFATSRGVEDPATFRSAGTLHLVLCLATPAIFLAAGMDRWLLALIVGVFLVPLLTHGWLPDSLRWAARRAVSGFAAVCVGLRLVRARNCLAASAATLLGGYLSTGHWWTGRRAVAAGAVFLLAASSDALNDLCDIREDSLSKPNRPIPSGRISPAWARRMVVLLAVAGLLVLWTLGWRLWLSGLFLTLLGLGYSIALKDTVLVGNAVVGFLSGATVVYGAAVAGSVSPRVLLAGFIIFLFMFSGEVVKCIADRIADAAAGRRTVATCLPVRTVTLIYSGIVALFLAAAVTPWVLGAASGRYLVAMIPAAFLPTCGVALLLLFWPGDQSIQVSLRVVKAAWFTGLAAMTFLR